MRITDLLRTMDIFEQLPGEELEKIARLLRERRLAEGQVLMREGEAGDAMFVVTGGKIRVYTVDQTEHEKTLAYYSDGQFFGEIALLTGEPRSASAVAESESRLLVLQKADFDELLRSNPRILREMLKVVSQRSVRTSQALLSDDIGGIAATGAGQVFAVFSPRGGSGRSTLAINLAYALERYLPERVALLDLDLTFGHTAVLLNTTVEGALADVPPDRLEGMDRQTLAAYFSRAPGGVQLLVGAVRPEAGETVTGEHVRAALDVMKRQFVATVVDCGGSFADPVLATLERADRVIVVCTPEVSTLRDLRECQRIFGEVVHLDRAKQLYVLNHNLPTHRLKREQFEATLERAVDAEIPHAGPAAIQSALKGEPLVVAYPNLVFSRALDALAVSLLPDELRAVRGKGARPPARGGANGTPAERRRGLLGLVRRPPRSS